MLLRADEQRINLARERGHLVGVGDGRAFDEVLVKREISLAGGAQSIHERLDFMGARGRLVERRGPRNKLRASILRRERDAHEVLPARRERAAGRLPKLRHGYFAPFFARFAAETLAPATSTMVVSSPSIADSDA